MNNTCLQHHGIKGMRWGIRRYQNSDGSLTPAGKRRLQQLDTEREMLTGKKSQSGESGIEKKKTLFDLPDNELNAMKNRQQTIKNYLEATERINELTPKEVSRGKKFIDYMADKVVIPAATDAAKNFMTKFLNAKGDSLVSELTKSKAKAS